MFVQDRSYNRRDLHRIYGGQQRGGISTPRHQSFIMLFTGETEHSYGYQDSWVEDNLSFYTGEGQHGDMSFVRGNRAVRDHTVDGKDLYLFKDVGQGSVRYRGQMVCTGFHERRGPDANGNDRRLIVFELVPIDEFCRVDEQDIDGSIWEESLSILRERATAYAEAGRDPAERKMLVRRRSAELRAYVLRRADGCCEACGMQAPFKTNKGRPYLEPHHIRRLSDGGPDHPRWVVALCPNCHRRAHYSEDKDEFYSRLMRIAVDKERPEQLSLVGIDESYSVTSRAENSGPDAAYLNDLVALLSGDLDFHGHSSGYASHNLHSFPAKFPPQLPKRFIEGLTAPGDVVLDPMMGSGTTVLEAYQASRRPIGFDIDPLALLVSRVKVTPVDLEGAIRKGNKIVEIARSAVAERQDTLRSALHQRLDAKTRRFADYWFAPETQLELLALRQAIEQVEDRALRDFFDLVFSAIIITKNGGVSLSFDLAHTRPHRAKVVFSHTGQVLLGEDLVDSEDHRIKILTKTLRSALDEFEKRLRKNLESVQQIKTEGIPSHIRFGDAQALPLDESSVDLIVTSPPYAANAIDYMRAHKFSLVWMGHDIDDLGDKRKEYIGGEATQGMQFEELSPKAHEVVACVTSLDKKKGLVLHRYFSEMTRVLLEMYRVLRPGRAAIVVVGSSTMRGIDTETGVCLADIGKAIGFEVPKIGTRHLDRNRRMMPAGSELDLESQIQQRMHEEDVIGFFKPRAGITPSV
ncbi:MAG: HNH endonuclease [Anaerolineae bacterium]|nr:HNH endonuclease [Anaerolineae bacterium]